MQAPRKLARTIRAATRYVLAVIPPLLEAGLVTRSECIWLGAALGVISVVDARAESPDQIAPEYPWKPPRPVWHRIWSPVPSRIHADKGVEESNRRLPDDRYRGITMHSGACRRSQRVGPFVAFVVRPAIRLDALVIRLKAVCAPRPELLLRWQRSCYLSRGRERSTLYRNHRPRAKSEGRSGGSGNAFDCADLDAGSVLDKTRGLSEVFAWPPSRKDFKNN